MILKEYHREMEQYINTVNFLLAKKHESAESKREKSRKLLDLYYNHTINFKHLDKAETDNSPFGLLFRLYLYFFDHTIFERYYRARYTNYKIASRCIINDTIHSLKLFAKHSVKDTIYTIDKKLTNKANGGVSSILCDLYLENNRRQRINIYGETAVEAMRNHYRKELEKLKHKIENGKPI